jgi:hypothetical protein
MNRLSTTRKKAGTFVRLPIFTKLWLVPVWLALGVANILLERGAFPRLSRLLGVDAGPVQLAPLVDARQLRCAENIRATIAVAAGLAPFRSDCLRQALVGAWLCQILRVPCALHLGAAVASEVDDAVGQLEAHAWLVSGPIALCGGRGGNSYAPLICLVHTPSATCVPGPGLPAVRDP